jgi:hypothetical protein
MAPIRMVEKKSRQTSRILPDQRNLKASALFTGVPKAVGH